MLVRATRRRTTGRVAPGEAGPYPRVVGTLAHGVRLRLLAPHLDDAGRLTELFRRAWKEGDLPVQWDLVDSDGGTQRGVHVHVGHDEVLVLLDGRTTIGLRDVRPGSPTEGRTSLVEVVGERLCAVMVPSGVARGILSHAPSRLLVGLGAYGGPALERGCHWLDPALGIPWPTTVARTSERDAALPPLSEIAADVPPWGTERVSPPEPTT